MSSEKLAKMFPETRNDVRNLKASAADALSDMTSTASAHASRVRGHLKNLADHAQDEGSSHFNRARSGVTDLVDNVVDFASERPLLCIGAALAVGVLIGLSRSRRHED